MKLSEESYLTDDFLRQLINVGEVDILVGLPTHNNAKTIGSIVHTIQSGILRGFPRERAVIINADGGRVMALPNWSRASLSMTRAQPPICTRSARFTQ